MSRWVEQDAEHLVDVAKDEVFRSPEGSVTVKACLRFEPHERHYYRDLRVAVPLRNGHFVTTHYDCGGIDEETGCRGSCYYGACSAPRSMMGCGGCCECMGGCQLQYEMAEVRKMEAGA